MKPRNKINLWVLMLPLFFMFVPIVSGEQSKKHILILNSYHPGFIWSDMEYEGAMSVFKHHLDTHDLTTLDVEMLYMNSKRFGYEGVKKETKHQVKSLLAKQKIDMILTFDDNALTFVNEHYDELFKNVPVVFAGVNRFGPERVANIKHVTGVIEDHKLKQMLEMIRRLHPDMKEIILVADSTDSAKLGIKNFYDAVDNARGYENIKRTVKTDWALFEIQTYMQSLNASSVVIASDFFRDRNKVFIRTDHGPLFLDRYDNVPIYAHSLVHKNGVTGGLFINPKDHGKQTAEQVMQVLSGIPAEYVPIIPFTKPVPTFRYRKLKIFDIPIESLPSDSVIDGYPKPTKDSIPKLAIMILLPAQGLLLLFIVYLLYISKLRKR